MLQMFTKRFADVPRMLTERVADLPGIVKKSVYYKHSSNVAEFSGNNYSAAIPQIHFLRI